MTYSGRRFWPLEPRPQDVDIEDIAHAMSMKCRFTGHAEGFISVAEHSVNVARFLPPKLRLHGLLHDAAEAYLPDIARPIKGDVYIRREWKSGIADFVPFSDIEGELLEAIYTGLGVSMVDGGYFASRKTVKDVDTLALRAESDALIPFADTWEIASLPIHASLRPRRLPWGLAKAEFMQLYLELTGGTQGKAVA